MLLLVTWVSPHAYAFRVDLIVVPVEPGIGYPLAIGRVGRLWPTATFVLPPPARVDRIDPRVVEDRIGYFAVWARERSPLQGAAGPPSSTNPLPLAPPPLTPAPTFLVFANFFLLVAYWGETALSPAAVLHNALTLASGDESAMNR